MKIYVENFRKYLDTLKPFVSNSMDLLSNYIILDFKSKKAMFSGFDKIALLNFDYEGEYERDIIAIDGLGFLNLVQLSNDCLEFNNNVFRVGTIETKLKESLDVTEESFESQIQHFKDVTLEIPLDKKFYKNIDKIVETLPSDITNTSYLGCLLFKEKLDNGELKLECRVTDNKKLFMDFYEDTNKFPQDDLQIPENVLKTIKSLPKGIVQETKMYKDVSKYRLENDGINIFIVTNSDLNISKINLSQKIPNDSFFEISSNLLLSSFKKVGKILYRGDQVKIKLNANNTINVELRESFKEDSSNIVIDELGHESINISEDLKGTEFVISLKDLKEGLEYFKSDIPVKIRISDRMLIITSKDYDYEFLCVLAVD